MTSKIGSGGIRRLALTSWVGGVVAAVAIFGLGACDGEGGGLLATEARAESPIQERRATGALMAGATHHELFRSASNHLHELRNEGTGWGANIDLTVLTGAPLVAGEPAGSPPYLEEQHLVYRTGTGHVIRLRFSGGAAGSWSFQDLTAVTGGMTAASDPMVYARALDDEYVIFRGTDGHLHQLRFRNNAWTDLDLTATIPGNPTPAGNPTDTSMASASTSCSAPAMVRSTSWSTMARSGWIAT